MKKYYSLVRSLHLYFGLFISPFILLFSMSVLVFNHPQFINSILPVEILPVLKSKLDRIPYDSTDLLTAKAIIQTLGVEGEIDFISQNENKISFPVRQPGSRTQITVDKNTDSVYIDKQVEGALRAMTYLHSMPGPHNEKNRGNSIFIRIWRILADIVVYVILLLSVTGIFLWYFLKVERNLGLLSLALGFVIFTGFLLLIF
jgi:hypothetical protein